MENEYKVSELAIILGVQPKTVYRMIERGDVNVSDRIVNNRKMTVILLTASRIEELKKNYGKMTDTSNVIDVEGKEILTDNDYNKSVQSQSIQLNPLETINKLVDTVVSLQSQVNDYSVKAGQTMLLTDNLLQKEKDLDYWKEEFFKLKLENERNKDKIDQLEAENQQLKQKSFFGLKFGK
ncbi:MAG: hypothetical protein WCG23_11860 [bacterium]